MPVIQIQEVVRTVPQATESVRWALDRPLPGELFEGDRIEMSGWLLTTEPARIEISHAGETAKIVHFDHDRGDVAAGGQPANGIPARGFRTTLPVTEWLRSCLNVSAQVGSTKCSIATIAVQRCWRESSAPHRSPLVSVIVMTNGVVEATSATLASITHQTHPHLEVLVVGKTGTNAMQDLLHHSPGACAVESPELQPSQCWNLGYRRTVGDHLIFLKGGEVVSSDFLERAVVSMQDHPEWSAVFCDGGITATDQRLGLIRRSVFDSLGRFGPGSDARQTLRHRLAERGWPLGDIPAGG